MSSITPAGMQTRTSHVPTVPFSSAALYSAPMCKSVLIIHLCSGIRLCRIPSIYRYTQIFSQQFLLMFLPPNFRSAHNSPYELKIALFKLTWRGNKSFKRSYNLVLLVTERGEKKPSVIVNRLFWGEKYNFISNLYLISISVASATSVIHSIRNSAKAIHSAQDSFNFCRNWLYLLFHPLTFSKSL